MIRAIKGYDFDDLLLVPSCSDVNSRNDVDLTTKLGNLELKSPIIATAMRGIVGVDLIQKIGKLGGIGILHRFYNDNNERADDVYRLYKSDVPFGGAIGINDDFHNPILGYGAKIICVDVANGYTKKLLDYCEKIKGIIISGGYDCLLMSGNVVTFNGVVGLTNAGVDIVRVGIGSGQLCTTREQTGVGYPQLSAIDDCSWGKELGYNYYIASDGGIRNSGDAVKALACGADVVMIGSLFAQCYESDNDGVIYGMASRKLQEEHYGFVKSVEGKEKEIQSSMYLEDFIDEFTMNIKSACAYMNVKNLDDLRTHKLWVTT